MSGIYDIKIPTLRGQETDLSRYRGKVLLIVNVASRCGFTPQYRDLQALYERRKERGFEILAFPCNDFAGQEPGTEPEIADFCGGRFGVTFPVFGKVKILGRDAHPLYRFLTDANAPLIARGGLASLAFGRARNILYRIHGMEKPPANGVQWNFQKFLIDRQGRVSGNFASQIDPFHPSLLAAIETLLSRDV
jgi:glutathione peroxidase